MDTYLTSNESYQCMQESTNIRVLQTLEEVEQVFSSTLSLWSSYRDSVETSTPLGVVGLDVEWRPEGMKSDESPQYSKPNGKYTMNPHRVALLQISMRMSTSDSSSLTYLIRMHQLFPHDLCPGVTHRNCALFTFLRNPQIWKCGVGIVGDRKKFEVDIGVRMRGIIELGALLERIKTHDEEISCSGSGSGSMLPSLSLKNIVQHVCGVSLPKLKAVQCSDWAADVLTAEQVLYAAADSYFSLLSFEGIMQKYAPSSGCDGHMSPIVVLFVSTIVDSVSGPVRSRSPHLARTSDCLSSSASSTSLKSKRDGLTAALSPIYDSGALLTKRGMFLSYCDKKRLNWYLSKGLADELTADAIQECVDRGVISASKSGPIRAIRLNFEAKGSGNQNDAYKRQQLQNICVVCGFEQVAELAGEMIDDDKDVDDDSEVSSSSLFLLHHHVVPKAYRRVFPRVMVSKNNHDVLPICRRCKAEVSQIYAGKMQALEAEHLDKSHREALRERQHTSRLDTVRLSKVQGYCQTLLTTEFHKKVKVVHEDGSKSVEMVPVSPENISKIKESVLVCLQKYCRESFVTAGGRGEVGSFDVSAEASCLSVDDLAGIQLFVDRYQRVAEERVADKRKTSTGSCCCCDRADEPAASVPVRNKETLIVQKLIWPHSLADDEDVFIPTLQHFEATWRRFFLDSVRPRFMPPHWRVDYKHTTLLKEGT